MAGLAFVLLLFSSITRGVFLLLIDPLLDEFDWSRGETTAAASVNILVFGFMGPFAVALTLRDGLRRVTAAALRPRLGAGASRHTGEQCLATGWTRLSPDNAALRVIRPATTPAVSTEVMA